MSDEMFVANKDVVAVDIYTMSSMSIEDYNDYLRNGLFAVDHHGVLRSEPAGYPFAVMKEQFQILVGYLKEIEARVGM